MNRVTTLFVLGFGLIIAATAVMALIPDEPVEECTTSNRVTSEWTGTGIAILGVLFGGVAVCIIGIIEANRR